MQKEREIEKIDLAQYSPESSLDTFRYETQTHCDYTFFFPTTVKSDQRAMCACQPTSLTYTHTWTHTYRAENPPQLGDLEDSVETPGTREVIVSAV